MKTLNIQVNDNLCIIDTSVSLKVIIDIFMTSKYTININEQLFLLFNRSIQEMSNPPTNYNYMTSVKSEEFLIGVMFNHSDLYNLIKKIWKRKMHDNITMTNKYINYQLNIYGI